MKKKFKFYIISWAILFFAFNVIVFTTPSIIGGFNKFGGAFWSGYIFITLALIGQLVCGYLAFKKSDTKEKLFLNLPLITISYSALITSVILGTVCMAIPNLPNWIGIILCLLILGFNAIAILKAQAAAGIVSDIGEAVKQKTLFIKELTIDAQNLTSRAQNTEIKNDCKEVYEAVRYSDPMSSEKLFDVEQRIQEEFTTFTDSVLKNNQDSAKLSSSELLNLIKERSSKCKLYK